MNYSKNYYDILDVERDATIKDIRKSYRRMALIYHPDRVAEPQKKLAEEKFKEIVEAHYILSDPKKKRIYDFYTQRKTGEKALDESDPTWQSSNKKGYTEKEVEDILKQYFGKKGFRSFSENQGRAFSNSGAVYKKDVWNKRGVGLSNEGKGAAVLFCAFFYCMTYFNRNIEVSTSWEFIIPLGLFFILFETEFDLVKEPMVESTIVALIWLSYALAFMSVMKQAF